MRSSGLLRSVEWQFLADVSGQPIGPIFKIKKSKMDREVFPKRRYGITIRCVITQKGAGLTSTSRRKPEITRDIYRVGQKLTTEGYY